MHKYLEKSLSFILMVTNNLLLKSMASSISVLEIGNGQIIIIWGKPYFSHKKGFIRNKPADNRDRNGGISYSDNILPIPMNGES